MSNVLQQITALVDNAKQVLEKTYYNDQAEFKESYVESPSGLLKSVEAAKLTFPIQYTDNGDFYYFSTAEDVVLYVTEVLEEQGLLSDSEEYESSDEWADSGC